MDSVQAIFCKAYTGSGKYDGEERERYVVLTRLSALPPRAKLNSPVPSPQLPVLNCWLQ